MNDSSYGEYTDCGCGIYLCKRAFILYINMSYNKLLYIATSRGLIRYNEFPNFNRVISLLVEDNINTKE